ncbi:MAG: Hydrogenobyrinate a,c-diamide synthase [Syntrophus sp. SKADARSKE-3]|nr:Hydrogenobyrinate a,c-diamide synthase [Syntrophus sp. SKADARSKE-3]
MICPRIVIGGAGSGVGKTSLCLAMVSALRRRGLVVQTFKVGPDFLDPTYLAMASDRPCYNLDGWMMGKRYILNLFKRATEGADIAVIEGVMGLFDGADPATLEGSTAEIAKWLKAPVVLVVNSHGMARSIAALVKGYAGFERGVRICSVLANQCGSERHALWMKDALRAADLPPLLGAVPRGALPPLPSRHLGLVTADRSNLSGTAIEEFAEAFTRHVSVEQVVKVAGKRKLAVEEEPKRKIFSKVVHIGIARDEAFHFYYRDLIDELELRGCKVSFFSPLADECLPEGIHGLVLGGGYPEEHAATLATNKRMLSAIAGFAISGRPVYAECGGLMYLSAGIRTAAGDQYSLTGLLPAWTQMLGHRKALGYVEVSLNEDSLWGSKGQTLRGHEFHYSELDGDPSDNSDDWRPLYTLRRRRSDAMEKEGYMRDRVTASYVHLHHASQPAAIDHFVRSCGGRP